MSAWAKSATKAELLKLGKQKVDVMSFVAWRGAPPLRSLSRSMGAHLGVAPDVPPSSAALPLEQDVDGRLVRRGPGGHGGAWVPVWEWLRGWDGEVQQLWGSLL